MPILEFLRKVFIPSLNEHVDIREARSFLIILQGDYLTAERSRGAQKIKINTDSPSSPYEGLVPTSADWHTKLKLLMVRIIFFFMSYHVVHIIMLSCTTTHQSTDTYYIPLL